MRTEAPDLCYHRAEAKPLGEGRWQFSPRVCRFMEAFTEAGGRIWINGGAIRASLLGRQAKDLDFSTDLVPDQIEALFVSKTIPGLGRNFGTVRVKWEGAVFEVTTLRQDFACDGRHAEVVFSRDLAADAARRDFTINALYLSPEGKLSDPAGEGLVDLAARKLKFIGEPKDRLREDHLRALRFFRFLSSHEDLRGSTKSFEAVAEDHDQLSRLSAERIWAELRLILTGENARAAVLMMESAGYWPPLLEAGVSTDGLLKALTLPGPLHSDPALFRLASLGGEKQGFAQRLFKRFRLSRQDLSFLKLLEKVPPSSPRPSENDLHALLYHHQKAGAEAVLLRGWLLSEAGADDKDWLASHAALEALTPATLPFSASDLIALGLKPGPALGEALGEATALWFQSGRPKESQAIKRLLGQVQRSFNH